MPWTSSPVAYPPSSSPPHIIDSRKRSLGASSLYPAKRQSLGGNGIDTGNPQISKSTPKATSYTDSENAPVATLKPKGPFVDSDSEDEGGGARSQPLKAQLLGDEESSIPFECPKATSMDVQTYASPARSTRARSSNGQTFHLHEKQRADSISYERLVAGRSITAPGKAAKSYYGINIHALIDQSNGQKSQPRHTETAKPHHVPQPSIEPAVLSRGARKRSNMLWTERYRARRFTDLVGDERTHRDVLRWIKNWDPIVFPGLAKPKPKKTPQGEELEARSHRKILMLTGPPSLGKTTLAHVCARQAGYEVVEINASDERTSQVVKGRIRDCVGTENVKGVNTNTEQGKVRKAGKPVCVVVDEVDGVVGGSSGGGEGGFIKALIDLVALDQKNSNPLASSTGNAVRQKQRGERFRLLRPIILVCNDVYHPALRPLRTSSMAEIIHIRKPPLDKVVARLKSIFDKEKLPCDTDGVRRLCEATWGVTSRKEGRSQPTGEGDMRGILVVGEWAASKLRASSSSSSSSSSQSSARLTKKWVEDHMTEGLAHGGGGARGVGRGGAKEVVERVFLESAGFARTSVFAAAESLSDAKLGGSVGVADAKKDGTDRLREIIDTSGESDRIITDCFATYPTQAFQDDTFLSKPNAACDWLHFHDLLSAKVHVAQEWELGSYLSHSILGLHHLFASPARTSWANNGARKWDEDADEEPTPFSGPRADYAASEAQKQNRAMMQGLHSSLPIPLMRSFRSAEDLLMDLLPHVLKMLTPDVKPVVVGGSGDHAGIVSVRKEGERKMVERAVGVMDAVGVAFERTRIEGVRSGVSSHVYRMEP